MSLREDTAKPLAGAGAAELARTASDLRPALLWPALALLVVRTPGWPAVGMVAAAGAIALAVPVRHVVQRHVALVTAAGIAAFSLVRILAPGSRAGFGAVVALVVAGVAEEAIFRRAMYGRLERFGPAVAIVVTSVAFGLVHAPAYGWGVVPIDIAAGLVLGWQRWASGGWTSPALTHVGANLLSMG